MLGCARVVAVAEHGDVDQMCRCRRLPDFSVKRSRATARPDRHRRRIAESCRCTCSRPASPDAPDHFHRGAFRRDPSKRRNNRAGSSSPSRMRSSSGLRIGNSMYHRQASIGYAARPISTERKSIDALSWVSNRMLGTPSLIAKDIVIGDRVQNFRCRRRRGADRAGSFG